MGRVQRPRGTASASATIGVATTYRQGQARRSSCAVQLLGAVAGDGRVIKVLKEFALHGDLGQQLPIGGSILAEASIDGGFLLRPPICSGVVRRG